MRIFRKTYIVVKVREGKGREKRKGKEKRKGREKGRDGKGKTHGQPSWECAFFSRGQDWVGQVKSGGGRGVRSGDLTGV